MFISPEQALPGEYGDGPIFALIAKNLAEVLPEAQAETVPVCTMAKHRGAHGLWEDTQTSSAWKWSIPITQSATKGWKQAVNTHPESTCSYRPASSGRWRVQPGWPRTWRLRRRGRGCGTLPECPGVCSDDKQRQSISTAGTPAERCQAEGLLPQQLVMLQHLNLLLHHWLATVGSYQVFFQTEMCSTSGLVRKIKYHSMTTNDDRSAAKASHVDTCTRKHEWPRLNPS